MSRALPLAVLAAVAVLVLGCSGHPAQTSSAPPARGLLVQAEQVGVPVKTADADAAFTVFQTGLESQATAANDQSVVDCLVNGVWAASKLAGNGASYWVTPEKITYDTMDAAGNIIQVSGLAFIPWQSLPAPAVQVPILMLQHGTQIYRNYAPSLFLDDMWKYLLDRSQVTNWAEAIVGYMYAHAGYVVVMADYPGIGISQTYHPYMDPSISHCVTDLLKAVQTRLASGTWSGYTVWNNQLFLAGYSEGSYATVQAAREFQEDQVTVTAVAAMDGPHDLSTTMRKVMIADQSSPSPYFLPYTLVSFENIQGDATFGYTKTMIAPYCTTLPPMMNGGSTATQVTAAMPARADGLVYPLDILTPGFLAELSNPYTGVPATDGPAVTALAANDSYRGWTPAMSLRLFHCATDDLVPVGNSQAALAAWTGLANVTGIIDVTPLNLPGESVHVEAAMPAYLAGFQWLNTFRQ